MDANGNSTLGEVQAGSMGEAWSDWYAMDYLVGQGLSRTRPPMVSCGWPVRRCRARPHPQRADRLPVGSTVSVLPGTAGAGPGGYTYGDFGRVAGGPGGAL